VFNDESDKPVDELVNAINKLESGVQHDIVHIRDRVKDTVKEIELSASKKGISGITTGFNTLDMFTGGWQRQDLVIVGGASSMGKTSLALALSFNATRGNIPTAIFSYEMSANQLIKRIISSESDIKNKSLIEGTLTDNEWHKMHSSLKFIEDSPLYIDECSKTSLRYLLNRIRQYVITKKVKLIMVDYLQLVTNDKKGTNREQEVSQIARSLKNIAKELNISIIALSQLSRNVEKRQGCRPTLADLRESGEIEQAADIVMLVYRPEYYGFQEDEYGKSVKGLAEIIFAKGRNIGVGSKFLNFDAPLTKFKEIQKVYEKT
jgi:replicative DNA helicase